MSKFVEILIVIFDRPRIYKHHTKISFRVKNSIFGGVFNKIRTIKP
jgi:hypothetical protein